MMNNYYPFMFGFYPFMFPPVNNAFNDPPTIHSILNSIVNFDNENPVKIKDLARTGREIIFDFDYPLSNVVNREDFECMILNHFMTRRIGFDTVTAFKLQLQVKMNEIMSNYNVLFNALDGWDLFEGEKSVTDNTMQSASTTSSTTDNRLSNLPQNEISNVQDGSYLTDYQYNQNSGNDNSSSNGHSVTTRTIGDKITTYKNFIENKNTIYGMIFKDLECLFYQKI